MKNISIAELHRKFIESAGISTDTRKIQLGEMFFCLKGENFNANKFANKALELGALYVIIDDEDYYVDYRTILVNDALEYLQLLAAYHRRQFDIPFIGITGTNGKTTTKELINAVLSKKFKTHATMGNFNNHIGVPLTILSIPNDTEIAIIEMGANHIGEIAELCRITEPNYGLITSIGRAHLEGFGSIEGVITTKTELYKSVNNTGGQLFVNGDSSLLMELSEEYSRLTYGSGSENNTIGVKIEKSPFASLDWGDYTVESQLVGSYNYDNIMAAICIGDYFHVDDNDIVSAIEEYTPENQRSQWKKTDYNELIIDAYNANPSSMNVAIQSIEQLKTVNKWLILGDMLELGKESKKEHLDLIDSIDSELLSNTLFVGSEFMKAGKTKDIKCFINTEAAAEWIEDNPIKEAVVLVKGSRGIALEGLLNLL